MSKAIVVANQKGGVGKTTTSINLAACLAEAGKKVLAIDMDPQGNMTSGFGLDKEELEYTIYELLLGDADVEQCISRDVFKKLSVIGANINLAAAEIELIEKDDKNYILKNAIDPIKDQFDFIIIDCPPSLNMLTINSMCFADSILVPIQCEYYALEGLSQLVRTIQLIQDRLNPELEVEGIVFTMYDARTNLSLQVVDNVKNNLDLRIFDTIIPRNVRLAEAPSYGMPIIAYDGRSAGAEKYRQLAKEIIKLNKKSGKRLTEKLSEKLREKLIK
ncbi:MAG: AAA family ATPase [Lachnospiraceae bacterium]|nr:AAA family ATPase [Lachnospiraceae bacterium]